MVHQERLEIGEKYFVSGIMAVLGIEAVLTVITCGMHFSWIGMFLGIAGFCIMLFLANRIYAGSRQAQKFALTWIGFQMFYAAVALYLIASAQGMETARQIGAPAVWPVLLKALVYLFLAWVLARMPTVRDFFAERRGEVRAPVTPVAQPAAVSEPGVPLEFTPGHQEGVRGLGQYLRLVVGALIALGALQILASVVVFGLDASKPYGLLVLVQGLLTVVLGMALGGPANEVRPLANAEEQTMGQLVAAAQSLVKFYRVQLVIGIGLILVVALRSAVTLL